MQGDVQNALLLWATYEDRFPWARIMVSIILNGVRALRAWLWLAGMTIISSFADPVGIAGDADLGLAVDDLDQGVEGRGVFAQGLALGRRRTG